MWGIGKCGRGLRKSVGTWGVLGLRVCWEVKGDVGGGVGGVGNMGKCVGRWREMREELWGM